MNSIGSEQACNTARSVLEAFAEASELKKVHLGAKYHMPSYLYPFIGCKWHLQTWISSNCKAAYETKSFQ